ncbi:MAG: DUF4038 domain-containing protein [Propionibacteriaceae bacterium]
MPGSARRRRVRWAVGGGVALVVLALVVVAAWPRLLILRHGGNDGRGNAVIPDAGAPLPGSWPTPTPVTSTPPAGQPAYVSAVSADRRSFVDQYGRPLLIRGDSPWSLLVDTSRAQAETYFATRAKQGFNAAIVSLLGATGNGAPSDDGATYDGLRPFVGTDATRFNEAYWARVRSYLKVAARNGVTVFLYASDAWVVGRSFRPANVAACSTYGEQVAAHLAGLPNLVWMAGGDYVPRPADVAGGSAVDHCIDAMMRGIRSTGDNHLFSVQLGFDGAFLTTDYPFWASRTDWNFVYTYFPTYSAVRAAYMRTPTMPALLGEANYERENNQPDTPTTTTETLRRQTLWALTSGAAGDFFGTADWSLPDGWETRLDSPGALQVNADRDVVAGLPWWRLRPDTTGRFLLAGAGTAVDRSARLDVLASDLATATVADDGTAALVYVPTSRTITVDPTVLAVGTTVTWVDPSDASTRPAALTTSYLTPGRNHDGGEDWLLRFASPSTQR